VIVPLSQPDITELEIEAVVSVLRGSQLSLGPKMEEFEQRVSAYVGVSHGIAVSSGTVGLHLCIRALKIGPGDEVIVPSFTFIAAANAIRYEGATPVFVDVECETLNLDPSLIERTISSKTRAILVVHTFGCPADMDAILDIADRHNLYVIEDACEAIGAEYRGKKVGSCGDAGVFAFYPNKQITTGEGGMIVTQDEKLGREMRAMRNHGRYPTDSWLQHSILGFNYRLSEMNCALGCAQMMRIGEILAKREAAANAYREALRDFAELLVPTVGTALGKTSWFVFVVRLEAQAGERDRVIHALNEQGIQCGRYFAPIHEQAAYWGWPIVHSLPVTEAESRRTIALPFFSNITEEQILYVANSMRRALDASARQYGQ
jgi:perosamine synthetase